MGTKPMERPVSNWTALCTCGKQCMRMAVVAGRYPGGCKQEQEGEGRGREGDGGRYYLEEEQAYTVCKQISKVGIHLANLLCIT